MTVGRAQFSYPQILHPCYGITLSGLHQDIEKYPEGSNPFDPISLSDEAQVELISHYFPSQGHNIKGYSEDIAPGYLLHSRDEWDSKVKVQHWVPGTSLFLSHSTSILRSR